MGALLKAKEVKVKRKYVKRDRPVVEDVLETILSNVTTPFSEAVVPLAEPLVVPKPVEWSKRIRYRGYGAR